MDSQILVDSAIILLTLLLVIVTSLYTFLTYSQTKILNDQNKLTNMIFEQTYEPEFSLTTGNYAPTSEKASLSLINSGAAVSNVTAAAEYTTSPTERSLDEHTAARISMIGILNNVYYELPMIPISTIIKSYGYLKLHITYTTKLSKSSDQTIHLDFAYPEVVDTYFPLSIEREHKGF